jgi:hypothetical protein
LKMQPPFSIYFRCSWDTMPGSYNQSATQHHHHYHTHRTVAHILIRTMLRGQESGSRQCYSHAVLVNRKHPSPRQQTPGIPFACSISFTRADRIHGFQIALSAQNSASSWPTIWLHLCTLSGWCAIAPRTAQLSDS